MTQYKLRIIGTEEFTVRQNGKYLEEEFVPWILLHLNCWFLKGGWNNFGFPNVC